MKLLAINVRRTVLTTVAALAVVPALTLAQPAAAGPAEAAGTTAGAAADNAHSPAPVTTEAWAAGRARFGTRATAAQAVEAYWTPERMRKARPIEESPAYQQALRKAEREARSGAPTTTDKATTAPARSVAPRAGTLGTPSGTLTAAFNPNYSYWQPTARTSGKVFFSMGSYNYVCSGTVVNSEGVDTVWTAGHCVHGGKGGSWAYNWQFAPAYDDDLADREPYDRWYAVDLWTKSSWINDSDFSADMGVAIMGTQNGNHIVSYLGGQGLRVNAGKNVYSYQFGYPAESPFDGGNLFGCSGWTSPEWSWFGVTSETIKVPCNMTRGSSGGAWLHGWDGNWGYLNGVNSRIDRIVNPTIMLSPYFDDTAWSLYNSTRYL